MNFRRFKNYYMIDKTALIDKTTMTADIKEWYSRRGPPPFLTAKAAVEKILKAKPNDMESALRAIKAFGLAGDISVTDIKNEITNVDPYFYMRGRRTVETKAGTIEIPHAFVETIVGLTRLGIVVEQGIFFDELKCEGCRDITVSGLTINFKKSKLLPEHRLFEGTITWLAIRLLWCVAVGDQEQSSAGNLKLLDRWNRRGNIMSWPHKDKRIEALNEFALWTTIGKIVKEHLVGDVDQYSLSDNRSRYQTIVTREQASVAYELGLLDKMSIRTIIANIKGDFNDWMFNVLVAVMRPFVKVWIALGGKL